MVRAVVDKRPNTAHYPTSPMNAISDSPFPLHVPFCTRSPTIRNTSFSAGTPHSHCESHNRGAHHTVARSHKLILERTRTRNQTLTTLDTCVLVRMRVAFRPREEKPPPGLEFLQSRKYEACCLVSRRQYVSLMKWNWSFSVVSVIDRKLQSLFRPKKEIAAMKAPPRSGSHSIIRRTRTSRFHSADSQPTRQPVFKPLLC